MHSGRLIPFTLILIWMGFAYTIRPVCAEQLTGFHTILPPSEQRTAFFSPVLFRTVVENRLRTITPRYANSGHTPASGNRSLPFAFTPTRKTRPHTQTGKLVPLPQQPPNPADNPTTPEKVKLGKMLFFDPRLSGNNQISCASCHMPGKAFGDGNRVSLGSGNSALERNTPSCLNVGFYNRLFWDGRASTLEKQALEPIQSSVEMNQPLHALEKELMEIQGYADLFRKVFDTPPTREAVGRALAAFQRTLITGTSPFDRFLMGDKNALSKNAKAGLELFRGEAGCIACHHGPLLSDEQFYHLGVSYRDTGRSRITGNKEDRFRFRTPSLRSIAETGPYMHDGSMETLEDVVLFYYRGVPESGTDIAALRSQSISEIDPLVALLRSLSGPLPDITPPLLP